MRLCTPRVKQPLAGVLGPAAHLRSLLSRAGPSHVHLLLSTEQPTSSKCTNSACGRAGMWTVALC